MEEWETPLADEILSINSIYGDDTFIPLKHPTQPTGTTPQGSSSTCTLRFPSSPTVILRLGFPENYPDTPPSVLGTQSAPKGTGAGIVDLARDVLTKVWTSGEPCIFSLVEEMSELLPTQINASETDTTDNEPTRDEPITSNHDNPSQTNPPNQTLGPEPPWTLAPAVTEKKSVFLARAAPVTSPAQAAQFIRHLLTTDKRAAKATHNMAAWRICGQSGAGATTTSFQDYDDDGETAAGGRLLHLLQLVDVWDVLVVVSRWYGGVQLGPDRFRIINGVARQALVLGGFVVEKGEKEGGGRKKGGR